MERLTVNILGISGAHRKDRNSSFMVQKSLRSAENVKNVKTKFIELADFKIEYCRHCNKCIFFMTIRIENTEAIALSKMICKKSILCWRKLTEAFSDLPCMFRWPMTMMGISRWCRNYFKRSLAFKSVAISARPSSFNLDSLRSPLSTSQPRS